MLTQGPGVAPLAAHQSRTRSPDRKKSITLQVYTRSSHHFAAGTSEWKTHELGAGPLKPTSRRSDSPDCSHRERTVPGSCRAAGIPRASQAQLAKYSRAPTRTLCCVGTLEKGGAMRIVSDRKSTRLNSSHR